LPPLRGRARHRNPHRLRSLQACLRSPTTEPMLPLVHRSADGPGDCVSPRCLTARGPPFVSNVPSNKQAGAGWRRLAAHGT
jgi:hypothetical protein